MHVAYGYSLQRILTFADELPVRIFQNGIRCAAFYGKKRPIPMGH